MKSTLDNIELNCCDENKENKENELKHLEFFCNKELLAKS